MEKPAALFEPERTRLLILVSRWIVDSILDSARALARDVRALETRLRLWLIEQAHALPQAPHGERAAQKPAPQSQGQKRAPRPEWFLAFKREERARLHPKPPAIKPATHGFRVFNAPRIHAASSDASSAGERAYHPPCETTSFFAGIRLQNRLFAIGAVLANPAPVVAYLARRLRKPLITKSAPVARPVKAAPITTRSDPPHTDQAGRRRPAVLPRPDI